MLVKANWKNYMKVYTFGDNTKPVMMLFLGTCCYWKNNFGHVIEGLKEYFLWLMDFHLVVLLFLYL